MRIRVQNARWWDPPVEDWSERLPLLPRALTATNQNGMPQSIDASLEEAQLIDVAGHRVVLVVAVDNLPKPYADLTRTMVLPVLKLCLDNADLRNHPLLRRNAPDIKSSAARKVPTKMREPQEREGLGFSLATPLSISDGEPPELDQPRLIRM